MKSFVEGFKQLRGAIPDRSTEAKLADSMDRIQAGAELYKELKGLWGDATDGAEPWQKAALVVGVVAIIAPPAALPTVARGLVGRLVAAGLIAVSQTRGPERDYDETVRTMRQNARAVRSHLRTVRPDEAPPEEPEPDVT